VGCVPLKGLLSKFFCLSFQVKKSLLDEKEVLNGQLLFENAVSKTYLLKGDGIIALCRIRCNSLSKDVYLQLRNLAIGSKYFALFLSAFAKRVKSIF